MNKTDSVAVLRELYRAYVNLLESGRDRIRDLGGQCDPVDVMERNDPALIRAREAIAALSAQGDAVAWAYRSEDPYDAGQWMLAGPTWEGEPRPNRREVIPLYLHPAPPGSDAVTEEMAADVLVRYNATAPSGDHWPPERLRELRVKAMQQAITNAALAARTGKGEANV